MGSAGSDPGDVETSEREETVAEKDQSDNSNPEADSFIREVQEELRDEQLAEAWRKYGKYVIGVAVVIIALVGVREGWTYYDRTQSEQYGQRYFSADQLIADGDLDAAVNAFQRLAGQTDGGRALLARLRAAATLSTKKDYQGAASAFFAIADDGSVDQAYRDLSNLLGALNAMNGDMGDDDLNRRIQPLTNSTSPWRHNALEIQALLAHRGGNSAKAKEIFDSLAKDATAPPAIRARAETLAKAMNG